MARAKNTDFLHNFRFAVSVSFAGQAQLGTGGVKPSAGFNTCSAPEATEEAVEYREGHYVYTQKYPGIPSVNTITLGRGVALKDGTMWAWMRSVIEGNEEYRADVSIYHFHRDAKPATNTDPSAEMGAMPIVVAAGSPVIEYKLFESFPTRHKVGADMDATGAEVSIQEIELAPESFEVVDHSNGI